MTPRFFHAILATGIGMTMWSALTLAAMHGGLWLSVVTR